LGSSVPWVSSKIAPQSAMPRLVVRMIEPCSYRQKTTISYSDMLAALRRDLIRHEYWAQAPSATTQPQITLAQSPSDSAVA
jgi:hypothetical protein